MLGQFCTGLAASSSSVQVSQCIDNFLLTTSLKVITDEHFRNNTNTMNLSYFWFLFICMYFLLRKYSSFICFS